jgi:phage-related protein
LYNGKSFRLFSFWDTSDNQETLVIATHGILKKTQKTPTKEIEKAEQIRIGYLDHKKQNNNGK